jgi:hypothetical protein
MTTLELFYEMRDILDQYGFDIDELDKNIKTIEKIMKTWNKKKGNELYWVINEEGSFIFEKIYEALEYEEENEDCAIFSLIYKNQKWYLSQLNLNPSL